MKNTMTKAEATEWVYDQDETSDHHDEPDYADHLDAAFSALHGRQPTDIDREVGLWSLCCNATPNCGTRPKIATIRITDGTIESIYQVTEEGIVHATSDGCPDDILDETIREYLSCGSVILAGKVLERWSQGYDGAAEIEVTVTLADGSSGNASHVQRGRP